MLWAWVPPGWTLPLPLPLPLLPPPLPPAAPVAWLQRLRRPLQARRSRPPVGSGVWERCCRHPRLSLSGWRRRSSCRRGPTTGCDGRSGECTGLRRLLGGWALLRNVRVEVAHLRWWLPLGYQSGYP